MEKVKRPTYRLYYSGKDYTSDIASMVESLEYSESLEGRAGSLSLELNNADRRWLGGWHPQVNDEMGLHLGYSDSPLLDCGTFWVDELGAKGSRNGDSFTIKAMSNAPEAIYSPQITKVVEGSFAEFAQGIGNALGMQVSGDLSGSVRSVVRGTGLGALAEEAKRLGKIMKTEENKVIFYSKNKIKANTYRVAMSREDIMSYSITDKASGRYTYCECRHWDAKKRTLIRGSHDAGIKGGGKATIWEEVTSEADAAQKAKSWLEDKNKQGVEVSLSMSGNVKLLSGIGATLTGFGNYDGSYYTANSKHSWSRSGGYKTSITLEK